MEEVEKHSPITLRRFNHALSAVVILICIYIILVPFLPQFGFWFNKNVAKNSPPLVAANENANDDNEQIPENNVIVIPSINLQQDILEGSSIGVIGKDQGTWHRPNSSSPDQGGNTVVVGHRFTYKDPNGAFYHLDKIKENDKIVMYWNKTKHTYRVQKVFTVKSDDTSIENSSDTPLLTLYTCTPLWSAKDRLVIQAVPIEETQ